MCLLSNSYALWFIYLAEHLRLCESNRKKGLNYAYKILIQMKNHQINKPDEICFRTMMQLCLVNIVIIINIYLRFVIKKFVLFI